MKKIFVLFLFLIQFHGYGQEFFQKLFGNIAPAGLVAHTVYPTDDGYLAVGAKGLYHSYNYAALFKFDSLGNIAWNKIYERSSSGNDYPAYMMKTSGGEFVIVGNANNGNQDLIFIIKTDSNGDTVWTKTYGNNLDVYAGSILETSGGYLVTGFADSTNGGLAGNLLMKLDTSGNVIWNKRSSEITGYNIVEKVDSGIVYNSLSYSPGSYTKSLTKCDVNGNFLWRKTYAIPTVTGTFFPFCRTNDNGFLIAASTDSLTSNYDIILVKTDQDGSIEWSKSYGGLNSDFPSAVRTVPGGGYVIAGYTRSFSSTSDVLLFSIDSAGNNLWSRVYGDALHDESCPYGGSAFYQTSDTGFIIAAVYDTTSIVSTGASDIFLIKTDKLGYSGCNEASVSLIVTPVVIPVTSDTLFVDTLNFSTGSLDINITSDGYLRTICSSIEIHETDDLQFGIFPNPTSGKFEIENLVAKGDVAVMIFDALGRKVYDKKWTTINSKIEIDISDKCSGIYFLQVVGGDQIYKGKVIRK